MPRGHSTTIGTNRKIDELTEQERRFCLLRVRGYSQGHAYRAAFNKPRISVKDASKRGSELANKPRIYGYVKSLYREAKKSDVLSHTDWLQQMCDAFDRAVAEGNMTAAASFGRLMGQGIGTLSETVTIDDQRMSDDALIERLAQDNPGLAEQLKRHISGKRDFDA